MVVCFTICSVCLQGMLVQGMLVDDVDEERYPFPIGVDCCFVFIVVCFTICSCCLQGMLVDDVDEERYPSPIGVDCCFVVLLHTKFDLYTMYEYNF